MPNLMVKTLFLILLLITSAQVIQAKRTIMLPLYWSGHANGIYTNYNVGIGHTPDENSILYIEHTTTDETQDITNIEYKTGSYVVGTEKVYRGLYVNHWTNFLKSFNGTLSGMTAYVNTLETEQGATLTGFVGGVSALDFSGTHANTIKGFSGSAYGVSDNIIGVYAYAGGSTSLSDERCYSVYADQPLSCGGQSYAGFFDGDINVTGTIYYGALQSNSPHLLAPDTETGYTRIIVTATDGTELIMTFEKQEQSYTVNLKPLTDEKDKLKIQDYKDGVLGKKQYSKAELTEIEVKTIERMKKEYDGENKTLFDDYIKELRSQYEK